MAIEKNLVNVIEDGIKCKISRTRAVSGGCISEAALVSTSSGEEYFLKWNANVPKKFFHAEATGLCELAKAEAIKIPQVILYKDKGDEPCSPFILLEALVPGKLTCQGEELLGEQLAKLHRCTNKTFGFFEDNFIGSLPQHNSTRSRWGDFFFENRLSAQAELGRKRRWFDSQFEKLLQKKEALVRETLNESEEKPALLHGDLWSGNVFWTDNGPALIDPAVYYGNREADLAFTELFGRFGQAFYQTYDKSHPRLPGYEKRKTILNLYHLMTHSNLFGGSYISSARSTLENL